MAYAVTREGTTLVTLHEGTDTTACDAATEQLAAQLAALADDDSITEWSIDDATVYEHPTAPFDPYTVSVAFTVTVNVSTDDATDADAAESIGSNAIDEALERADVDAISYTSSPATTAC